MSSAALASTDSWRGGTSAAAAMNVFGPLLWTDVATLSSETKSYLVKGAAGINTVAAFGGTGSVSATALNSAGTAISASSSQWTYLPYYNGVAPTASSFAQTAPSGVTAPKGTAATGPDLSPLRTKATQ
ncbi:hypothetical protein ACWGI9_15995 [Streptomyces sp. NPDC054833]